MTEVAYFVPRHTHYLARKTTIGDIRLGVVDLANVRVYCTVIVLMITARVLWKRPKSNLRLILRNSFVITRGLMGFTRSLRNRLRELIRIGK